MDETEVQVEIACWVQAHPEASAINSKGGNEPWVTFCGKLCTLYVRLRQLIWCIEVPTGYQTEVSPIDGTRKRCWEPFDHHDTVIVPDRNTPFRVSVVNPSGVSDNVLDSSTGLERDFASKASLVVQQQGYDYREAQEMVHNLFASLQVSKDTDISSDQKQKYLIISNACFAAMQAAETLSEVLDAIYGLTTIYCLHSSSSTGASSDESHKIANFSGALSDDEVDDLFAPEKAIKWKWIHKQVEFAADVCRNVSLSARSLVASDVVDDFSGPEPVVKLVDEMLGLGIEKVISDESGVPPDFDSDSTQTSESDEYAYITTLSGAEVTGPVVDLHQRSKLFRYNSDTRTSVLSDDGSWEEVANLSDVDDQSLSSADSGDETTELDASLNTRSKHKRKLQQVYPPAAGAAFSKVLAATAGPDRAGPRQCKSPVAKWHPDCSERQKLEELEPDLSELQYCDITFNSASYSAECTLALKHFMQHNPAVATALGLSLEHTLVVEIVPNKAQVDALSWTGSVEVYVSQPTDWHNHMSEEICGLLCFVPNIVKNYFDTHVSSIGPTTESKGELFTGVMQTLVRRLSNLRTDLCCICSARLPGRPETPSYPYCRVLWTCSDIVCQDLYDSWQMVSSVDADDRTKQDNEGLEAMEETLRADFPYSETILDNLRSALDVYRVDSEGLHYGQMIRALARIELWNERDPKIESVDRLF